MGSEAACDIERPLSRRAMRMADYGSIWRGWPLPLPAPCASQSPVRAWGERTFALVSRRMEKQRAPTWAISYLDTAAGLGGGPGRALLPSRDPPGPLTVLSGACLGPSSPSREPQGLSRAARSPAWLWPRGPWPRRPWGGPGLGAGGEGRKGWRGACSPGWSGAGLIQTLTAKKRQQLPCLWQPCCLTPSCWTRSTVFSTSSTRQGSEANILHMALAVLRSQSTLSVGPPQPPPLPPGQAPELLSCSRG